MPNTKLGVLGLGSQSTLFYLNELNRLYQEKKGGFSTCPLILLNTNFDEINSLLPERSDKLTVITQDYFKEVRKLDLDHILIPNITLHETIDQISITENIIHPLHLTASEIRLNSLNKVVLFGTLYTMQSDYIASYLDFNGIETLRPSQKDMQLLDEIRRKVYANKETKKLIKAYHLLIDKYSAENAIVLACTELSLIRPSKKNSYVFDMTQIQIEEAIKCVL